MINPNGPYPGRQLFLGLTEERNPFFVYLVTGRSPESRERKAVLVNDVIRMGPVGNSEYDPLRHYAAVKFDNASGLLSVSNGIQTEAIFEAYRLIYNTASSASKHYMETLLDGAGAEPDSYHTPRIAGVITYPSDKSRVIYIIGMKAYEKPAKATLIEPRPGTMTGISTYRGSMESPLAREPGDNLPEVNIKATLADDIARFLFDISASVYKGNDIRVSAVAGVRKDNHAWSIAVHNVH